MYSIQWTAFHIIGFAVHIFFIYIWQAQFICNFEDNQFYEYNYILHLSSN